TRHHEMVDYFNYVDAQLSNVQVYEYGKTYEDRPLLYTIIASEENFKKLEEIRKDNLIRAGVLQGTPSSSKVAIVWMSYNVHGNEASAMEAAITTLYELCTSAKAKEWLKNTVVIIDPCINPDGRDRYANFNNAFSNTTPNTNGEAAEHREPWPGGRPNHYWFDLNRDWAWLQQKESAARIPVYNQWLPHVHVDFHEQGYNSPYYFAPAAEPYHQVISKWQREFQHTIGKNNAKYFDSNGWLYFTKEVFDLYYPSYGDTYPTYSGAIGMTYEQAGSGYAGLSIQTEEGDPLTLEQRIKHHHTTGLSTVEITSQHANRVVDEFEKYHKENINNPFGTYKTYVIKGNNNPDKLNRLAKWLQHHDIQFGLAGNNKPAKGFNYQNQSVGNVTIESNDIVINTYQPKSRFITTVFEPQYKV
ncbi:MAG: M14 family metallopeptidase, partial [Chryseotalea sp.]